MILCSFAFVLQRCAGGRLLVALRALADAVLLPNGLEPHPSRLRPGVEQASAGPLWRGKPASGRARA